MQENVGAPKLNKAVLAVQGLVKVGRGGRFTTGLGICLPKYVELNL